jgi:hypothetical protein
MALSGSTVHQVCGQATSRSYLLWSRQSRSSRSSWSSPGKREPNCARCSRISGTSARSPSRSTARARSSAPGASSSPVASRSCRLGTRRSVSRALGLCLRSGRRLMRARASSRRSRATGACGFQPACALIAYPRLSAAGARSVSNRRSRRSSADGVPIALTMSPGSSIVSAAGCG